MAINERLIHTAADAAAGAGTGNQEDGLVLHLDANDVDSYDGDGSIWYDIKDHEYTPATNVSEHFNTVIWDGDGSTDRDITGVGFQPDLVWVKKRANDTKSHRLADSVRGAGKIIYTDLTNQQATATNEINDFITDGFNIGNASAVNDSDSNDKYVAWCFKAGGAAVSNTDGTITSQVSANNDLGFSIVKYTGTTSADDVGHGLNVAPDLVIAKTLDSSDSNSNWIVNASPLSGQRGALNLNISFAASTTHFRADADSTVLKLSSHSSSNVNRSGEEHIAYCFASKRGVSKVGSYTGTGAAGNKVYTGFEPAFVMLKITSSTSGWVMIDSKRNDKYLLADTNDTESSLDIIDFNRDGFTFKGSSMNGSGNSHIYLAFAKDTNETDLIDDTDLGVHLDAASYSGSGTTWTADAGNDGTVTGATYDQELGDWFSFDGYNDYVSVPNDTSFASATNFSVEMWVNPISIGSDEMLATLYGGGADQKFDFRFGSSSGDLRWIVGNSSGGYSSSQNLGSTSNLSTNTWYHIVAVYDDTNNKMFIYIDGELDATTTGATNGTYTSITDPILIGKRTDGYHSNIKLGQFRLYSSALTQDQVRQNFNFTKNDYPNEIHFTGNNISSADWNSSGYFDLDGSTEYFETSGNPSALINATNFTFQTWVKMHTTGTQDYIVSQTTADGNTQNWLLRFHSDNKIKFYVYGTDEYLSTTSTYSANVWYHIAGVIEADGIVKIYVNGELESFSGSGKSADTISYNTFIGSLGGSSNGRFDGNIGAVKYYSKALTASELLADYNATKSTYGL